MNAAVAVMTRLPVPGQTKTRLMPWLTAEECAEFHRRCLSDICTTVRQAGLPGYLFYAGEVRGQGGESRSVGAALGLPGEVLAHFTLLPQEGEDLGERMLRASQVVLAAWPAVVVVGSDMPDLDAGLLHQAVAGLRERDLVLGPARDGGYYLIAFKAAQPCLFQGIAWGTAHVLEQTLRIARTQRLSWHLLETRSDIDTWDDLSAFSGAGRERPGEPHRYLSAHAYAAALMEKCRQRIREE